MQRLIIILLIFSCLVGQAAELRLELKEKIKTTRKGQEPTLEENLVIVRFGKNVFYVIRNRLVTFYDFDRAWIMEVQEGAKVAEYPMLAVLAERVEGLLGSLDTYRTMARAGVLKQNDRYAMFNLETRHALQSDIRSSVQPRKTTNNKTTNFTLDGKLVGAWTNSDYKLSDKEAALLGKFLLYEARLHPDVRKSMVSNRKVPKKLRFRYETPIGDREVEWETLSAGLESDTAYTKAIQEAPRVRADELDRLIAEELPARGERALTMKDFDKMFAKSMDLRYYLDAMLVSVEFYLMSGRQTVDAIQKIKPFIEADPQLVAYLNGLEITTHAAAKSSMMELANINRTNIFRQHILDVALADTFKETLKYRAAEELYIKALQQNPYMTGVWVGLGDLYYRTMRMEKAWKCWNVAFAIRGDHPMLDAIKQRNELLSAGFPEYL